jgi:hypothetical protein
LDNGLGHHEIGRAALDLRPYCRHHRGMRVAEE